MGARSIVTCWWKAAFLLSLLLSVTDLATRFYTHRPWSRVFRPAVFFFVGPKVTPTCRARYTKGIKDRWLCDFSRGFLGCGFFFCQLPENRVTFLRRVVLWHLRVLIRGGG